MARILIHKFSCSILIHIYIELYKMKHQHFGEDKVNKCTIPVKIIIYDTLA